MSQTADPWQSSGDQFRRALLESRQRWQGFGTIAADILFEIDADGRLCFLAPDTVLGWPASELIGRPVCGLLMGQQDAAADRFATGMRHRRTWARRADGKEVCLAISSAPLFGGAGECVGARGVAVDVTAGEYRELQAAATLRRAEVLDHIMDRMRQEVLAPRMMAALLDALARALGGEGAAVLDLAVTPEISAVLHQAGHGLDPLLPKLLASLRAGSGLAQACRIERLQILACPASTRFGHQTALTVWREPGRDWDSDDRALITSVAGLVRIVLEHEAIQRELARQARTDVLTGLLNRRAFIEEARRRIDRLERDGLPGTLMYIDLDCLKPLNDRLGHEAGDSALVRTGHILRRIFRPADLVARLGGDEFAVWLDGFDDLTAAERAESLRLGFPHEMADLSGDEDVQLSMSIGIACRQPGSGEELDEVIQRADQAMYDVKRNGRGHWRVSHVERVL